MYFSLIQLQMLPQLYKSQYFQTLESSVSSWDALSWKCSDLQLEGAWLLCASVRCNSLLLYRSVFHMLYQSALHSAQFSAFWYVRKVVQASFSRTFLLPQKETQYSWAITPHHSFLPASGNQYLLWTFRDIIQCDASVAGLIHSASCFQGTSILWQGSAPHSFLKLNNNPLGFPCGSAGKESSCDAGDLGLIPGLGRPPGEGKGYPLQNSGLESSMYYI